MPAAAFTEQPPQAVTVAGGAGRACTTRVKVTVAADAKTGTVGVGRGGVAVGKAVAVGAMVAVGAGTTGAAVAVGGGVGVVGPQAAPRPLAGRSVAVGVALAVAVGATGVRAVNGGPCATTDVAGAVAATRSPGVTPKAA